ncbi:MAG: glycosyltransferase family 2 protein [Bacteroidaceae bacterium]
MNPTISIIIPVYNTAEYLPHCIESVLAQTYINFELILVDDGSIDQSPAICDAYGSKDHRIKVIHKANGGVSSARNVGLDNAIGQWIVFIDADDWVGTHYIDALIKAVDNDQMLIFQGVHFIKENKDDNTLLEFDNHIVSANSYKDLFSVMKIQLFGYPFSKLFNRAILTTHNIRFDQDIRAREDLIFMLHYLLHIKMVKFISNSNYYYRIFTGGLHSVITSYISEHRLSRSFSVLIDAMDKSKVTDYDFKELKQVAASCLITAIFIHYRSGYIIPRNERLVILNKLTTADLDLIKQFYILQRRAFFIPLYLIKHKSYKSFDFIMIHLFKISFFN